MKLQQKIFQWVDRAVELVGSVMVFITIGCTTINILLRWTVGRSIGELDEITLMAFVWVIYIGMGLLYKGNEHVSMDFILKRLPRKGRVVVAVLDLLIEFGTSLVIAILAFKLMCSSMNRTLNVTHVPYSFLHLAIFLGFVLMIVSVLCKAIRLFAALIHGQDPFEEAQP